MSSFRSRPHRHGDLPSALSAAARAILDESGFEAVGSSEAARRIGLPATTADRHFSGEDDLLASVAAEGFRELSNLMEAAADGPDPMIGSGLAYLEFALRKQGLFRLMFGPLLEERARYPALHEAAAAAFDTFDRVAGSTLDRPDEPGAAAASALSALH